MKKIAIVGGGIAGLAAAYELELARRRGAELDWHLYEASERLGGIVETRRIAGDGGAYILEGGPDAWVSDKPWARELAIELGLEAELIFSNDATRKTYILIGDKLQPMPERMRMMVPEDLATLEGSPLFSSAACAAYAAELVNAAPLKDAAPDHDESVADFVRRHFGTEVLETIAAPLLSGVFGGDVHRLSVRAVMAPFVAMEREHGSLIAALQWKTRARGEKPRTAIFTSLRCGMGSLVEALAATLPAERLHLNHAALSLKREGKLWCLRTANRNANGSMGKSKRHVHHALLATPLDVTRSLLERLDAGAAALLPAAASSALLATFCWSADAASSFELPLGFGFLVPQTTAGETSLLACTFADQKFSHRVPSGCRIVRTFFGGPSADALSAQHDAAVAAAAFTQLKKILGPLPEPIHELTWVCRWPRSLPQYEVGHLDRIAELDLRVSALNNLALLGNAYRGVGLPDLIQASRAAAKALTTDAETLKARL